jgi:hypothetical protein
MREEANVFVVEAFESLLRNRDMREKSDRGDDMFARGAPVEMEGADEVDA